jgi:hypothetical protein
MFEKCVFGAAFSLIALAVIVMAACIGMWVLAALAGSCAALYLAMMPVRALALRKH